ncbi:uncharacterized protein LOC111907064 [Lactuca sativa]|uniref:uncharacterized protein LOC111907064 n=1 Tax=Lactuca sativa TaxID=4236 RepID=UPI0022AEC070|nr:uncharacterized protein LOC111907064 [Lactuca sativa]
MRSSFEKAGVKIGGEEKKKYEKYEKVDENVKELKAEKKLKGDSGVNCHYCNGANHFAADCMLRKKDEKKSKVKDEAYYAEKLEEVRAKEKGLSLVAKGEMDNDESGTYQIWSSGSDDEEMRHLTHSAMFASFEKNSEEEEEISGHCFVSKSTDKSPMTTKILFLSLTKYLMIDLHMVLSEFLDADELVDIVNDNNVSEISEIEEEEKIDYSKLSVINITSKVKGKEIVVDSIVKVDTNKPSTSQLFDFDDVEVRSSQTDDTDDDEEMKTSCECKKEKNVSTETSPTRVFVEQVYGDSKEFHQVLNAKGAHYLETNTVVYPNFTCTDKTVFPNQVFVTTGNVEQIKPEFNKMVEIDNKRLTTKGKSNVNSINSWLEGKGKQFQNDKFSQQQIKTAFEKYVNESYAESLSSNGSTVPVQKWKPVMKVKQVANAEVKIKENPKLPNNFISISRLDDVDLIQSVKEKLKTCGCSRHMTGRKENLRDYKSLENARVVKFGNNHKCQVKGYGKVTNGQFTVVFNEEGNIISKVNTNEVLLKSKRYGDMFTLDIKPIVGKPIVCLLSKASNDISWLWYRRLSHLKFRNINKLVTEDLGKQHRKGHPIIIDLNIVEPLELLNIDLCVSSTVETLNKRWLKSEVAQMMIDFIKKIEMSLKKNVCKIKSNNGSVFKNLKLDSFITAKGISHIFSSPYTPQKNGVVERRNRCFIMNLKDNLSKFDAKADEGIFLGYSHNSVAYRVVNKRTQKVEENFNLTFDDYFLKQIDRKIEQKPIIADSNNPVENENTIDFDYELIFGIPDRVIDVEIHATNNQSPEPSKHIDDSPHTSDSNSSESMPEVRMEGEHTTDEINVQDGHTFEGEKRNEDNQVEMGA